MAKLLWRSGRQDNVCEGRNSILVAIYVFGFVKNFWCRLQALKAEWTILLYDSNAVCICSGYVIWFRLCIYVGTAQIISEPAIQTQ